MVYTLTIRVLATQIRVTVTNMRLPLLRLRSVLRNLGAPVGVAAVWNANTRIKLAKNSSRERRWDTDTTVKN